MQTTAASGSGEPLERSDYCGEETLPRSGLLELGCAADCLQPTLRSGFRQQLTPSVSAHKGSTWTNSSSCLHASGPSCHKLLLHLRF